MGMNTCSIDGCEKRAAGRGWCSMHYRRWRLSGDPGPAHRLDGPKPLRQCKAPGCDSLTRTSGADYCEMHYGRVRRHGNVQALVIQRPRIGSCQVDGCRKPDTAKSGLCSMHAARITRHGDPSIVIHQRDRAIPRDQQHRNWAGDEITYSGMHQRLRRLRGHARRYTCVSCGERARHWSYDHSGIAERIDPTLGLPFSTDPNRYDPRCVPCHKRHDLARVSVTLAGAKQ